MHRHAIALDVDPENWALSTGKIPVKREDRLFDLVWLWSWYGQKTWDQKHDQQMSMEHEIAMLSHQVFSAHQDKTPSTYELHLLRKNLSDQDRLTAVGFPESFQSINPSSKQNKLLYRYLTSADIFQRGQEIVWIDPSSEGQLLLHIQNELRRKVGTLGITIEVNPSSNLLIGDMSDLNSHPLWRLRPPIPIDNVPPVAICIGSDDPVVFSTDLRQEYQRVLDALIMSGLSDSQAERWVEQTRASGLNCRFTLPVETLQSKNTKKKYENK